MKKSITCTILLLIVMAVGSLTTKAQNPEPLDSARISESLDSTNIFLKTATHLIIISIEIEEIAAKKDSAYKFMQKAGELLSDILMEEILYNKTNLGKDIDTASFNLKNNKMIGNLLNVRNLTGQSSNISSVADSLFADLQARNLLFISNFLQITDNRIKATGSFFKQKTSK